MASAFRTGRLALAATGIALCAVVWGINALGGWKLLLHNADVQAVFEPFLGIRAWGLIPFSVLMAVEGDWIGQAKTGPILALALIMASTNVVLDAMWVEGWWGGTAMGARGAAYASLTAESLGAVFAWFWSSRQTHPAAYMGWTPRHRAMERQWWSLSAPVMAQFGMTIGTWASFFFCGTRRHDGAQSQSLDEKCLHAGLCHLQRLGPNHPDGGEHLDWRRETR